MTIYDDHGNKHDPEDIKKIISLVPSISETIYKLGGSDYLIGISDYCVSPESLIDGSNVIRVGGVKNPDINKIISLDPDICIVSIEENRKIDADTLRDAGINLFVTDVTSILGARSLISKIGALIDRETEAEFTVSMIDYTMEEIIDPDKQVSIFIPVWYDPWMAFNNFTYAGSLLQICGGKNVFGERNGANSGSAGAVNYFKIDDDDIKDADPRIIILPDEPFVFSKDHLDVFRKMDLVSAREDKIKFIDGKYLFWYGIRTLQSLPVLAALIKGF
ncbi:MAG: helical backbone metal receptor [Candidatus Hodarchaeales archaeon]